MTDLTALGKMACVGWAKIGKPSPEAWNSSADAVADAIADRFHDEQIQIWAHDLVGELGMMDFIKESASYDDVVDLHKRVETAFKEHIHETLQHVREGK